MTLEVRLEDKGLWRRQFTVMIPVERVVSEMEKVVEEYRRRAAIPGFRKGKVPTELIRGRFHGDVEADLLNELIPTAYEEAIRGEGLNPCGPPRFHGIRFMPGEPLRFLADFEIWPEIEVQGYRGLELEQEIFEVDAEMIAESLEALRQSRAVLERVERSSRQGDIVKATLEPVDVHGKRIAGTKREEVRMEAGSPNLLAEFQKASVGVEAGERRLVEVHYPEGFRDRQLAGKTRRFRLTVREINEKKSADLDESFARGIDPNLDLDGLRAKLRLRMESEELIRSKERLEETLIGRLLEMNPFPVPEVMMGFSLDRIVERARGESAEVDEAAVRERFAPVVERMHRRDILFQNVARQESLAVTDDEMEAEIDRMAEEAGVEVPLLRKKLETDSEIDRIRDTLQERKVTDFLVASARVSRVQKPRPRPEGVEEKSRIVIP